MFHVFLKKKIKKDSKKQSSTHHEPSQTPWSERRRYERFTMDYKHITIQNEADILTVRDLSIQGFSTEVSPRFFERVSKEDQFEARLRYMGEIYDLSLRVAWKAGALVGFQIIDAPAESQLFLRRVLQAAKIGNSLKKQDFFALKSDMSTSFKEWFHSPEDAELFIWRMVESGNVMAWQLTTPLGFVEWSDSLGLVTGVMTSATNRTINQLAQASEGWLKPDQKIDVTKKQIAIDILMALRDPVRDELVATLTTSDGGR